MRKGHIKLIRQAEKCGFSDKELDIIKSSTLTLDYLDILVRLITYIRGHYEVSSEITDACLSLAGYEDADSWLFGNNIRVILFQLMDLHPTAEEILWLKGVMPAFPKENGCLNAYDVAEHWTAILYMKRNGFPADKTDYILRILLSDGLGYRRYRRHSSSNSYLLKILSSCIGDDFKYNDNSFLVWSLSEEPNILIPYYARNKFERFYDWDLHKFTVDIRQFYDRVQLPAGQYNASGDQRLGLKLQKQKLYDILFAEKRLFSHLYGYVAGNFDNISDERSNMHHDLCFRKVFYYEDNVEKHLRNAYDLLNTQITAVKNFDEVAVLFSDTGYIRITIKCGNTIEILGKSDGTTSISHRPSVTFELMATPDETLFLKTKTKSHIGKFKPLSVTEFRNFLESHTKGLQGLSACILSWYSTKSMLPKDVLTDLSVAPDIKLPFTFNELIQYHNRSQFIEAKFKTAAQIPVNWNKRNIVLSWLIIHSWNILADDKSRQILMQTIDSKVLHNDNDDAGIRLKGSVKHNLREIFLSRIITGRIRKILDTEMQRKIKKQAVKTKLEEKRLAVVATGVLNDEKADFIGTHIDPEYIGNASQIAYDYVIMCRKPNRKRAKGKVSLDIKSYAQLRNRHDRFNNRDHSYYEDNTGKVAVPKDSKFNTLREYLPDEFEWIQDRDRLILETELQHHCVWSYAGKISKDDCAIYSYVDAASEYGDIPKRYTIEFGRNKQKYYVVQVQGRFDRVNTKNMREHIQKILDTYQNAG